MISRNADSFSEKKQPLFKKTYLATFSAKLKVVMQRNFGLSKLPSAVTLVKKPIVQSSFTLKSYTTNISAFVGNLYKEKKNSKARDSIMCSHPDAGTVRSFITSILLELVSKKVHCAFSWHLNSFNLFLYALLITCRHAPSSISLDVEMP